MRKRRRNVDKYDEDEKEDGGKGKEEKNMEEQWKGGEG